jgi:hypothetical protein
MRNKLLDLLKMVTANKTKHPLIKKYTQVELTKFSSYYDNSYPLVTTTTFMDPRCKMNNFFVSGENNGVEPEPPAPPIVAPETIQNWGSFLFAKLEFVKKAFFVGDKDSKLFLDVNMHLSGVVQRQNPKNLQPRKGWQEKSRCIIYATYY